MTDLTELSIIQVKWGFGSSAEPLCFASLARVRSPGRRIILIGWPIVDDPPFPAHAVTAFGADS